MGKKARGHNKIDDNDDLDSDTTAIGDYFQLVWQGSRSTAPAGAEDGWVYFNTGDGKLYVFIGGEWQELAINTIPGVGGTQLVWKGEFAAAPANPEEGWLYYNTSAKASYIYLGGKWNLFAKDGGGGSDSENIEAAIARAIAGKTLNADGETWNISVSGIDISDYKEIILVNSTIK